MLPPPSLHLYLQYITTTPVTMLATHPHPIHPTTTPSIPHTHSRTHTHPPPPTPLTRFHSPPPPCSGEGVAVELARLDAAKRDGTIKPEDQDKLDGWRKGNSLGGAKSSNNSENGLPLLCITNPINGQSVLTWPIKSHGCKLAVNLYLYGEGSDLGLEKGCELYNKGMLREDGTYKTYPSIRRDVRCKGLTNPKGVWKTEFCEKYVPGRVWTWASKMPIDRKTGEPWVLEVREATDDERKTTLAAEGVAEGIE